MRVPGLVFLVAILVELAGCAWVGRHPIDARSRRVVVPRPAGALTIDEEDHLPAATCAAGCPHAGAAERLEACYSLVTSRHDGQKLALPSGDAMVCQYLERS